MTRLVPAALLLGLIALASHPAAGQRSIMNFADVLNRSKDTFRALCGHDGHLNDTDDPNTLQCLTPEREPDFVIASYANGNAQRWGAKFPTASKAYDLKRMLTDSYGPPTIQSDPDEEGCVALGWAPATSSLIYTVAKCPRSTLFIVQFQPGK